MLTPRFYMRIFVVLFVLVTVMLITLLALRGEQRPGCVIIRSDPSGAIVFDSNREIGATPLRIQMRLGEYRRLRLVKRGYKDKTVFLDRNDYVASGWRNRLRTVTEEPEADLLVTLKSDSSASIHVTSDPTGAEVFLGDIRVGMTPFMRQGMRPGHHTVRVTRKGYFTQEKTILLEPGNTEAVHIVLRNKTEALYRDLIASQPYFLPHYSELIHYYLLRGDVESAIAVMNEGFEAARKPNAAKADNFFQELVNAYTRYYSYPTDIDEAVLRKAVRDVFARTRSTSALHPKRLQAKLKELDRYDKQHPLPTGTPE